MLTIHYQKEGLKYGTRILLPAGFAVGFMKWKIRSVHGEFKEDLSRPFFSFFFFLRFAIVKTSVVCGK